MSIKPPPTRELNRLKDAFTEGTYPDIDRHLYEIESIHIEKGLLDLPTSTFRKLVEFLVDHVEGYGYRIDRRKNNIIINSGVLQVLIKERLNSIERLKQMALMFRTLSMADTELNQGVVLSMIDRWWSTIPDCIGRGNAQERGWYYYNNSDLAELLEGHLVVERRVYQQLVEAEIYAEELCKARKEDAVRKEKKQLKREVKAMVKAQRKEALAKTRAKRRAADELV